MKPPFTESEVNDEQIHDHRFSFWSGVLLGRMVFQNYVRDGSGAMFNEHQYIPEKSKASTIENYYIDVGKSPLVEVAQAQAIAGEQYYLPFSKIHRVILLEADTTCTLVLRGPRQKNYASIFSTHRKYSASRNEMFSATNLVGRLRLVIDEIAAKRTDCRTL